MLRVSSTGDVMKLRTLWLGLPLVIVCAIAAVFVAPSSVSAEPESAGEYRLIMMTPGKENTVWLITSFRFDESEQMYVMTMKRGSEIRLSPAVPFRIEP
jgi:hypothetical protein